MTSQRIGKYACLEIERRYLLRRMPEDVPAVTGGWLITDHYLPNTRLRLRKMESITGIDVVYKLTQKYRSETQSVYETTITNLYLTEAEYNFFQLLEANVLRKRRYPYSAQDHDFSIDVFEGRHQGMILAEMEVESKAGVDALSLPSFVLRDVTEDSFFTGGNLVTMTDDEFKQGLAQRLYAP